MHNIGHFAPVLLRNALGCEHWSRDVSMTVHGSLQRIVLPSEEVISMVGIAGGIIIGPYERLLAVDEVCWVVEGRGFPNRLEKDLRKSDWMG